MGAFNNCVGKSLCILYLYLSSGAHSSLGCMRPDSSVRYFKFNRSFNENCDTFIRRIRAFINSRCKIQNERKFRAHTIIVLSSPYHESFYFEHASSTFKGSFYAIIHNTHWQFRTRNQTRLSFFFFFLSFRNENSENFCPCHREQKKMKTKRVFARYNAPFRKLRK